MRHFRYLVYWDHQNKPQKQVALWTEDVIYSKYAMEHMIKPQNFSSLGYIGFDKGKWVLYEHYQMDTDFPKDMREDKTLVQKELYQFSERDNVVLQAELSETYQKEKNLLLYASKETTKRCIQNIKNRFTSGR